LVGWFQHHPYLETSKPEPISVGGVKGVQFDVVLANQPANHKGVCGNGPGCQDIFALSTGGSSEVFFQHRNTYIVLKDVKGVPVVIQYSDNKGVFDEFVPEAKKVLQRRAKRLASYARRAISTQQSAIWSPTAES
jgi:hypothetical protein